MSHAEDEKAFASIRNHPGYFGGFTRFQIEGAYPNGTRVVKAKSEETDVTATGTLGTVLGSINHPTLGIGYFIEWDDKPKTAVFVIAWKLASRSTES